MTAPKSFQSPDLSTLADLEGCPKSEGDRLQAYVFLRHLEKMRARQVEALEAQVHKYKEIANIDEKTGLYNDRYANEELERLHNMGVPYAVIAVDLDEFKQVNDEHGHAVGDELLAKAARLMEKCVRPSDAVCRVGGDESIIIMPHIDDPMKAAERAEQIRKAIAGATDLYGVTASIGVAVRAVPHAICPADVREHADRAAYASKDWGKNSVSVYSNNRMFHYAEGALKEMRMPMREAVQHSPVLQPLHPVPVGTA